MWTLRATAADRPWPSMAQTAGAVTPPVALSVRRRTPPEPAVVAPLLPCAASLRPAPYSTVSVTAW